MLAISLCPDTHHSVQWKVLSCYHPRDLSTLNCPLCPKKYPIVGGRWGCLSIERNDTPEDRIKIFRAIFNKSFEETEWTIIYNIVTRKTFYSVHIKGFASNRIFHIYTYLPWPQTTNIGNHLKIITLSAWYFTDRGTFQSDMELWGEDRTPASITNTNVIPRWKVKLPPAWPVDDQIRQISVSGSWQVRSEKQVDILHHSTGASREYWGTDRGQDQLIIIQLCGCNLSKLKVLLQCSSLIQYLLWTTLSLKTTYSSRWYRCYNILKH